MDTFIDFVKFSFDLNAPLFIVFSLLIIGCVSRLFWLTIEVIDFYLVRGGKW